MKKFLFFQSFWSILSLAFFAFILIGLFLVYLTKDLPNVSHLKEVQLQVPLRVYTRDGKLIAEYGEQRRIPVTLDQVPKPLINAVLATEDQRFYLHSGVDIKGLLRAAKQLMVTGDKQQGGSTITMQVARNFFLSHEKTFIRKFKEILLAIKIDYLLDKDTILELYLNKIYFGNRAYGIAAAAHVYYGKTLGQLTLAEMAMLAGLPKAPSTINPLVNPQAAMERRNHVLYRMLELGHIDQATYEQTVRVPLSARYHGPEIEVDAGYVGEMARQYAVELLGEAAYTGDYQVYTTVDSTLQQAANVAVQKNILEYEERYGYRGPVTRLGEEVPSDLTRWQQALYAFNRVGPLRPAVVIAVQPDVATALLRDGRQIELPWKQVEWARPYQEGKPGPQPEAISDVLAVGDVIYVRQINKTTWRLSQIPAIAGSLVALNPINGAVLGLTGGFDFATSHFNRVIQAERQPGSSFKPFVYAAALAKGFTLASVLNDAPVVLEDPSTGQLWRPKNSTHRFYGPTRLRVALRYSRNLVSIRLLDQIGIGYAIDYLQKFGFKRQNLPYALSLALGSGTATPLEMAIAYAVFANGGYRVEPYLVERITQRNEEIIFQADPAHACPACFTLDELVDYQLSTQRRVAERVITPQVSYLMNHALQDVVQRGTGRRARVLRRADVAGKTGSTNDLRDGWFAGYTPDIVAISWIGFDQPRTTYEQGAQTGLTMWIDFMRVALQQFSEKEYIAPPGIVTVKIDPDTGLLARPQQTNAIFELFTQETVPQHQRFEEADLYFDEASLQEWEGVF